MTAALVLALIALPSVHAQSPGPDKRVERGDFYLIATPESEVPPDAREVTAAFEKKAMAVREEAERRIDALREKAVAELQPIQDEYTRAAKLDQALAVRGEIDRVRGIRPDPGAVPASEDDIGKTWYFDVVGMPGGSVWGSGPYTTDSRLASAVVHAGVLKPGEHGVVKVRIVPGAESYDGSSAHGVVSQSWGRWPVGYQVEKASFK